MGRGGRVPNGGRNTPSGPPPPGPAPYRQPGGPSAERPEAYDRPPTAQPVDIGYSAPDNRNKLQKPGAPLKKQPTLPDIGYVAQIGRAHV